MTLPLEKVDITGVDDHPPTASVKLNGPPGTGKTTQSGARVAKLIQEHGYDVSDVAWCTYRKSLATETLQRLVDWNVLDESELSDPTDGPTRYIATTHAVANRVTSNDVDVASYRDKLEWCKDKGIQFKSWNQWKDAPGEMLFDAFQYIGNNLLDPHKQSDLHRLPNYEELRDEFRGEIGAAWDDWMDWKAQRDLIDYWEMLKRPLQSGARPPRDILVVDEYHDATPLMAELCEYWAQEAEIVIIAGDPNQVVNNYAGADPMFFERVDYPEILLDKTYRVPYEHWAVATDMLSNAHRVPPVTRNSRGRVNEGPSPSFDHDSEQGWVQLPGENEARSPPWMVDRFGNDMMFLTRTRKQADGIAASLERAGVLFQTQSSMERDGWQPTAGPADMNTRTALFNALQKLKGRESKESKNDGLAAFAAQTGGREDVDLAPAEAAAMLRHARATHLAVSRGDAEGKAQQWLDDKDAVTLDEFREFTEPVFWDKYTNGAKSVDELINGDTSEADRRALPPALERNDGVIDDVPTKVYTIHASKGNEAENVVVYDGITKTIAQSMQADVETEKNEWRTWYVALTRASETLFIMRDAFGWMEEFLPDNIRESVQNGVAAAEGGSA
jgi:DNA helicase-2/ATP-dependent DNA helicase PcrA